MTEQYLRSLSLSVGNGSTATNISTYSGGPGLRVRFQVKQGDIQTPNNALITITNLSDQTAQTIQKEYDKCVLQVGYGDSLATVFQGEIRQKIGNAQETPVETKFQILAAEGQTAYSYAVVNKTLAAGHTFRDQVNAALEAMKPFGIVAGFIADLGSQKMPRGRALFGMAREQLRTITQATDTSWWIDGNKLNIVKNDGSLPGGAIVVNSQTGMIGMPIQTIGGIEVRVLLNPQIKPGVLIQINENDIQKQLQSVAIGAQVQNQLIPPLAADGVYRVMVADHVGDTRGTEWYSDLTCLSASSDFIPAPLAARGVNVIPKAP